LLYKRKKKMPKKFKFFLPDENQPHFSCNLKSNQCKGKTKNGNTCKNKTLMSIPYCWIHLQNDKKLRIKDSLIPGAGKGLFAVDKNKPEGAKIFKKGQVIIQYSGEIINEENLNHRYGNYTAPYSIITRSTPPKRYIDSACERGAGAMANQGLTIGQNNAKLSPSGGRVFLTAIKDIKNNQEILTYYGDSYHFDDPTHYSTR
jgi:hypothetical protein